MARFITENQFEEEAELIPGRYGKDMKVGLLFGSGAIFAAAVMSFILDGWENAVFLLLASIWMETLYLCVEDR